MTIKLGVVMDPIADISYKKDSTLAMLWAAQARDWELYYMEPRDLYLEQGITHANMSRLTVFHDPESWFSLDHTRNRELSELDVILMRKDPPFDNEFLYTTYLLEEAERRGTLVVNRCGSLRDCNEKIFATWFPGAGERRDEPPQGLPPGAPGRDFQAPGRDGRHGHLQGQAR
jgi:glutathione synthase